MEEVDESLSVGGFPDFDDLSFSLPEQFPLYVSIFVVACTSLVTGLFYLRKRRITLGKGRRAFVIAGSYLSKAQSTSQSPTEAKELAEQAILEADIAISIDPNDAAYHIVKALALEVAGKSGAAIKELADAVARPKSLSLPERSSALVKKAALESESGLIQEALLDLQEAVTLSPTNPRLQLSLGEAYEKVGNIDKAIEAFNTAILLDPKFPDAKEAVQRLKG